MALKDWKKITDLKGVVTTRKPIGWMKEGKLLSIDSSVTKGGGWVVMFPLEDPKNFKTKPEAMKYAQEFMRKH